MKEKQKQFTKGAEESAQRDEEKGLGFNPLKSEE